MNYTTCTRCGRLGHQKCNKKSELDKWVREEIRGIPWDTWIGWLLICNMIMLSAMSAMTTVTTISEFSRNTAIAVALILGVMMNGLLIFVKVIEIVHVRRAVKVLKTEGIYEDKITQKGIGACKLECGKYVHLPPGSDKVIVSKKMPMVDGKSTLELKG